MYVASLIEKIEYEFMNEKRTFIKFLSMKYFYFTFTCSFYLIELLDAADGHGENFKKNW